MTSHAAPPRQGYSLRIDRALKLAAIVHDGQRRRGTRVPYIMHPVQVARILEGYKYAEDVVVAALLHDVVEDARPGDEEMQRAVAETFASFGARVPPMTAGPDGTSQWLRAIIGQEFGGRVLALVDAVTEQKREHGIERPWQARKREALGALASEGRADPEIVALKAADALHNVRSIAQDLAAGGVRIMSRFGAEPDETVWYFRRIADIARSVLKDAPLAQELRGAVDDLAHTLREVYEQAAQNLQQQIERDAGD